MTTILDTTRETLRKSLDDKMLTAISSFDPKEVLEQMRIETLTRASQVADEILGIDRRWSTLDLNNKGLLYKHLEPSVKNLVTEHLAQRVEDEVIKLLASKQIQDLMLRAIKRHVKDHISSLGGYKIAIEDKIEAFIDKELETITDSWLNSHEDETWLQ